MKRIVGIYMVLIALIPVHLIAQVRVVPDSVLRAIANPPLLKGEVVLDFVAKDIHIGTLSEDDAPVAYRFTFSNVSKKSITLTKVTTSCGCTVARFDRKEILPGKQGSITLTFNPFEKAGTVDMKAFVYTNLSSQWPTAKIALIGEVTPTANEWKGYPCAMGALRLKRNKISFNELTRKTTSTERMVVVNSGKKPLCLSALMIPRYARFRTEPEVIPPGEQADIVITIDGRLLPPTVKDDFNFSIILDGLNARPSDRTIRVKVKLSE